MSYYCLICIHSSLIYHPRLLSLREAKCQADILLLTLGAFKENGVRFWQDYYNIVSFAM